MQRASAPYNHLLSGIRKAMREHTPDQIDHEATTETSSMQLHLLLLQVAGGNPAVAERLREVVWQEYCDAGRPFGPSEKAMLSWLAHERQGRRQ